LSDTNKSVRANYPASDCKELVKVVSLVGDKWTIMVVSALSREPSRYNQLRRTVEGISQRMLTLTLKGLEQDGIIKRTMYPTIPPRVEYDLTDLGRTLVEPLHNLLEWALEHRPEILEARKLYAGAATQSSSAFVSEVDGVPISSRGKVRSQRR